MNDDTKEQKVNKAVMFEKELTSILKCRHPNVVQIYYVSLPEKYSIPEENQVFSVMEFAD